MEEKHYSWGGAKLLVVGQAPLPFFQSIPSVASLTSLGKPDRDGIFLLYLPEAELTAAANFLFEQGIPSDQILLCLSAPTRHVFDPFTGTLELLPDESNEDLRQRILARLETQRHRRLGAEIERARQAGLPSHLSAEEWIFRMEKAHLTHAFCCSLELSPSRHRASLRFALEEQAAPLSLPWPKEQGIESLLPLLAHLALEHWKSPQQFREEFKRAVSHLSFRTRTDLREVLERCMEAVWKGAGHAA